MSLLSLEVSPWCTACRLANTSLLRDGGMTTRSLYSTTPSTVYKLSRNWKYSHKDSGSSCRNWGMPDSIRSTRLCMLVSLVVAVRTLSNVTDFRLRELREYTEEGKSKSSMALMWLLVCVVQP